MPLSRTADILAASSEREAGVASFNVIQLEHITAFVSAAEQHRRPVILQISQNAARYHSGLAVLGAAAVAAARRADVPVAVHLDHATDTALVDEAVNLGFTSVMFDASTSDYEDNVARTAAVVRDCHSAGVLVEAELGEVGGKDGVHTPGVRTDPGDATRFVDATGVDALAVAVGTSHAMVTRDATLDLALISRLRAAVPVPLVLHGSSGVPDADLTAAVESGMTKINLSTRLNAEFTAAVRGRLDEDPDLVDPRKYLGPGRTAAAEEAGRLLDVLRTIDADRVRGTAAY